MKDTESITTEAAAPERPKRKQVRFSVRKIDHNENASLVEWSQHGEFKRGFIPSELIVDGMVDQEVLEAALPYGFELESIGLDIPDKQTILKKLEAELHKSGIWTAADIMDQPGNVQSAIHQAVGATLAALLTWASKAEKEENKEA